MNNLQQLIDTAYENRQNITPQNHDPQIKDAIQTVIDGLNAGKFRIAEKINGDWITHQWLKKAVLLYFKLFNSSITENNYTKYFDKVPAKFQHYITADFQQQDARIVPPAAVREGCFIGKNTVVMPSFINIGAYVDEGVMVDTWATVGSCAQIGKNVHLSGGVGIGGVLEPLQANPTIIEDNCFIGARSEIVEGVIVETGSVISMGVFIGQSTRIYNRETKQINYGRIPAGSVVVSGNLPAADGSHSLYCAVIVKQVDAKTREKVGINELLRTL